MQRQAALPKNARTRLEQDSINNDFSSGGEMEENVSNNAGATVKPLDDESGGGFDDHYNGEDMEVEEDGDHSKGLSDVSSGTFRGRYAVGTLFRKVSRH